MLRMLFKTSVTTTFGKICNIFTCLWMEYISLHYQIAGSPTKFNDDLDNYNVFFIATINCPRGTLHFRFISNKTIIRNFDFVSIFTHTSKHCASSPTISVTVRSKQLAYNKIYIYKTSNN